MAQVYDPAYYGLGAAHGFLAIAGVVWTAQQLQTAKQGRKSGCTDDALNLSVQSSEDLMNSSRSSRQIAEKIGGKGKMVMLLLQFSRLPYCKVMLCLLTITLFRALYFLVPPTMTPGDFGTLLLIWGKGIAYPMLNECTKDLMLWLWCRVSGVQVLNTKQAMLMNSSSRLNFAAQVISDFLVFLGMKRSEHAWLLMCAYTYIFVAFLYVLCIIPMVCQTLRVEETKERTREQAQLLRLDALLLAFVALPCTVLLTWRCMGLAFIPGVKFPADFPKPDRKLAQEVMFLMNSAVLLLVHVIYSSQARQLDFPSKRRSSIADSNGENSSTLGKSAEDVEKAKEESAVEQSDIKKEAGDFADNDMYATC